jgi:uncharacterized cofD-like protein
MLNFNLTRQIFNNKKINDKTICVIGGGTGLFSILSGLKKYTSKNVLKAIVTTLDNGGSSGKLITQYGILPPGDIRNCLVALSNEGKIVAKLFQYRFDTKLYEHNFGNLLIKALTDITGNFDKAIEEASKILRINGEVIPVSLENNELVAEFEDEKIIYGESEITEYGKKNRKKIKDIYLKFNKKANKKAIENLKKADYIIFGPGSLYTSIIPNILFKEIKKTICENKKAKKILIPAVMSQPGETDDFSVSDFIREIEKYLECKIDIVLANNHIPSSILLKKYSKENKFPIYLDLENLKNRKIIIKNLIDEKKIIRHDSDKLAKEILNIIKTSKKIF